MHQDRRRAWARAVLVLATLTALLVVLAPAAMAQDQPANPGQTQTTQPGGGDRCDTIPNPVAKNVCRAGTNPGQAVTSAVAGAAQNVVSTAGDSALRSFTAAVASAG
ncbi:MAG TPA: hypothetical protein VHA34_07145 [Actinomycetes bacterium]|nr:hypothetical protein [Actinomycetes bacterium]